MIDTPIIWLTFDGEPARGKWDHTWLEDLLPGGVTMCDGWPDAHGTAVVVVMGSLDSNGHNKLAGVLNQLDAAVLVVASNEESQFDHHRFAAPNRVLWLHTPVTGDLPPEGGDGYARVRFLPTGWTPGTVERFAASCPAKDLDWSFAGQVTHPRRRLLVESNQMHGQRAEIHSTKAFAAGIPPAEYADLLRRTMVAPCPAGAVSLDTFRVYEALQAGAVPVLDTITAGGKHDPEFWDLLFGVGHPFNLCPDNENDWDLLPFDLHTSPLQIGAWWTRFKRQWRAAAVDDLELLGVTVERPQTTAVITASPVPSHPDHDMLKWVVESIIETNLDCEIIIAFDGVRPEQYHRTADYHEHIRRVLWAATNVWDRVSVHIEESHVHQANLFRNVLPTVTTPLVLFMEHDTDVTHQIDWDACQAVVRADDGIDMLRFHYSRTIHRDHEWLLVDRKPTMLHGCRLQRTRQWSQRPHLAKTGWYRDVLETNFPAGSSTMIEDRMHSVAQRGDWDAHRLAIYTPDGPYGFERSGHYDGRATDTKYEMDFGE